MIEREFIRTKIKNLKIRARINKVVTKGASCGKINIEKTPLGEKIIIDTLRPGLVIGRGGETIKKLTAELKSKYRLENPQIEVREILKPNLVASTVAKRIADEMERFGPQRFKSMGYRSLGNIMKEGAMGAEIVISGRGIPSQRSKTWRFYAGYLKKCGDIAASKIDKAIERANLRSGAVGIIVRIMLPGTFIPDHITVAEPEIKVEAINEAPVEIKANTEVAKKPEEKKEIKVAKKAEKKPEEKSVTKPKAIKTEKKKSESKKTTKKTEKKSVAKTSTKKTTKKEVKK
jgi:small subunit ribosomal protein S3